MVDRHRHCLVCGMPVSAEKDPPVCTKRCEYALIEREKKAKMTRTIMFLPLIAILAIFLVSMLLASGG